MIISKHNRNRCLLFSLCVCLFSFSSEKKPRKIVCVISHLVYLFTWKQFNIACSVIFVTIHRAFRLWFFSLEFSRKNQNTLNWICHEHSEREKDGSGAQAHKSKICNEIGNVYAMCATIMHGIHFQWCDYEIKQQRSISCTVCNAERESYTQLNYFKRPKQS